MGRAGGEDWVGLEAGIGVGLEAGIGVGLGAGQGQAHLHCRDDEAPVHDELAERRGALVAAAAVHHEQAADVLEPSDGEVGCQRGLPPLLQGRAGCSGPAEPTGQRHAAGDGPAGCVRPTAPGSAERAALCGAPAHGKPTLG